MQRVLLIGSSYSSAPILNVLRSKGFQVEVCGALHNDPCHEYADSSHFIDYSDANALAELIERERFDYIVPSCNDFAYMSGVVSAERFKYPGFDNREIAQTLHTKTEFRKFTRKFDIPAPKWQLASHKIDVNALRFPVIVKPDDAFSGRGVSKLASFAGMNEAVETARESSRTSNVVVEEFVEGQLHSHSAFISDGKIVQEFFVDEFCIAYPYQVDCSNHPSFLSSKTRLAVRKTISKIVDSLALCDGLLHTQFISNDEDYWIIECMRRAPGDLFANLISYSTDVNYTELYTLPFVGEKIVPTKPREPARNIARHTISTRKTSSFFSFSHSLPTKKVSFVPLKNSGHLLKPAPYDKAAILFAEMNSLDELRVVTPAFGKYIQINSIEGNNLV